MQFSEIQALFYEQKGIDLKSIMHELVSFEELETGHVKALKEWIKKHSECKYIPSKVIMYHGTAAKHNITEQGIYRTRAKTKRSMQSQTGYTYLSLYPESAKRFAEMAYPKEKVAVYAVEVPLADLKADKDQLFNARMWKDLPFEVRNSLAESLIFGTGARLKRDIHPYEVRKIEV